MNKVNRASVATKALALNVKTEKVYLNSGVYQASFVAASNQKAANKIKTINSALSSRVSRVSTGNIAIIDDAISVHV